MRVSRGYVEKRCVPHFSPTSSLYGKWGGRVGKTGKKLVVLRVDKVCKQKDNKILINQHYLNDQVERQTFPKSDRGEIGAGIAEGFDMPLRKRENKFSMGMHGLDKDIPIQTILDISTSPLTCITGPGSLSRNPIWIFLPRAEIMK